jgi:hypothetical protein
VFIEITRDLVIDLADLERKAAAGARMLLLSHKRGHLPDMEAVSAIAGRHGLIVFEDCAHTMGATWVGRKSGNFGLAGCFSTQTYKHMNSGKGGLLASDDAEFMARAIVMSRSYMLYERHGAAPDPSVFAGIRLDTPNLSGRPSCVRNWQCSMATSSDGTSATGPSRPSCTRPTPSTFRSGHHRIPLPHERNPRRLFRRRPKSMP